MGIWPGMVPKINVALVGHWFTLHQQYSSGTFYFLLGLSFFFPTIKLFPVLVDIYMTFNT